MGAMIRHKLLKNAKMSNNVVEEKLSGCFSSFVKVGMVYSHLVN